MTCRTDSGIKTPADFKGKTLGVWSRQRVSVLSWRQARLFLAGGPNGITVLKQGFNVDPLLQKQAACISTMTYNEYWQLIEAGMTPAQLTVFKYENQGVAVLEDGLWSTEAGIKDPVKAARLAKFVKASIRGWRYAIAHQDEAVQIVLANDTSGSQTAAHQQRMMSEIAKLIPGGTHDLGYLDECREPHRRRPHERQERPRNHEKTRGSLDPRHHGKRRNPLTSEECAADTCAMRCERKRAGIAPPLSSRA